MTRVIPHPGISDFLTQYPDMERTFTVLRAYKVACMLVAWSAQRFQSDNLWMLLGSMDLTDFSDSSDPALLVEWKRTWGEVEDREEKDVLALVADFVLAEGIWDPEERGPQQLHVELRQFIETGVMNPTVNYWRKTAAQEGDE